VQCAALVHAFTDIMSDAEDASPKPESLFTTIQFSVKLLLVVMVEVPGSQNRKGKLKTTKEMRTKVFSLPIDNSLSSYEKLLQTIIDKHNQPYKVSIQKSYIFQCVVGNRYFCYSDIRIMTIFSLFLSQRSSQTMDIETYSEFQEMVELLQEEEREKKVRLSVELEKIKKVAKWVCLLQLYCHFLTSCHLSDNI
jgi:hypothetical protein